MLNPMLRLVRKIAIVIAFSAFLVIAVIGGVLWYLIPKLPSTAMLKDVQLQVPLRVYTRDERLIAEFGEKRRIPLSLSNIPDLMIKAVLAAEDERFFEHPGVDWQGIARAIWHLLRTGEKGPGGSTITMQVARNFFLGREKTYLRKLNEILLAFKIERNLSKPEILELYLNKIFLGHRAYGVGAAAQTYYGQNLSTLSLAQLAMIAGLPKAPSRFNPIANRERAKARRNYVLSRMRELDFISDADYQQARGTPIIAALHGFAIEVEAPYIAEMVRSEMESRFAGDAYTSGYRVYTTIDSHFQIAANQALREALLDYDKRHGFRGPERHLELLPRTPHLEQLLTATPAHGDLEPAIVVAVRDQTVSAVTKSHGKIEIPWKGLSWARRYLDENRLGPTPRTANEILKIGDIIRARRTGDEWYLSQVPDVEGALIAINPTDGAIMALSGGFDFDRSKFNRAVQARRQPGSSFKPFIYSAALERGFTAASIVNDAPIVFDDPALEATWRPENYSGKFFGPTRLREALVHSRNLVSIRLLQAIGIDYAVAYLQRFGFATAQLPRSLSLALGSGTLTPLELATGYCVFASGGYRVEPYLMQRLVDSLGHTLWQAHPLAACQGCAHTDENPEPIIEPGLLQRGKETGSGGHTPVTENSTAALASPRSAPRALTPQNAWIMNSLLRDVIQNGTGRRARVLSRRDLAGKTGTTNDQRDAWFAGFNPTLVAVAWVGFDRLQPLGDRETGGRAALPMWIEFMRKALQGRPEQFMEQPEGMITVRIDPETGYLASTAQPNAIFETFKITDVPKHSAKTSARVGSKRVGGPDGVAERLF